MNKNENDGNQKLIRGSNRRHGLRVFVWFMACVVVFCTTYAMILPAITMEKSPQCGLAEHTHGEACYSQPVTTLCCNSDTLEIHVHSAACDDADGNRLCGYADFVVHTHTEACRDEAGSLICQLPEIVAHQHTREDCYTLSQPELHSHDASCYEVSHSCGLEESSDHFHTDSCCETQESLICTLTEGEPISSAEPEYILTCEKEEILLHTHGDDCW